MKQTIRVYSSRTRWLTFIGTILVQFALGSVYTWSLFNAPFSTRLNVSITDVAFTFGILSLALAFASSFAGKIQEKFGVRKATIGSGILMFVAFFLTAHAHSLPLLWITAGVLIGLADGAGYLLTLSNCVKWFPEKRGLISAFSIGAYGLGSLAFKFIDIDLMQHFGLSSTLIYWGGITGVICIIGALLMTDAPFQKVMVSGTVQQKDYSLIESMKKSQYWILALMFTTSMMGGLYVIGVAKDIAQSYAHLDALTAANTVTVVAVCNLLGRLVMGILSDKISCIRVVTFGQVVCLVGIICLNFFHLNEISLFFALGCVVFNFGGHLTTYPSLVSEFFGLNNLTKNYGVIYLGFGLGSFLGSLIASLFGGFQTTFWVIFVLLIISIICSLTIRRPPAMLPENEPAYA